MLACRRRAICVTTTAVSEPIIDDRNLLNHRLCFEAETRILFALPLQTGDVMRAFLSLMLLVAASIGGPGSAFAAKADVTGMCVCKKGSNVLNTYSETLCVKNDHAGCTSVKVACVNANATACRTAGGTISQSTKTCRVGAKC
ncbi:MAG: hypothetical protein WA418_24050 [Bradyrhizobium sp.]